MKFRRGMEVAARGAAAVWGRILFSFTAVAEISRRKRDSRARKSSGRVAKVQSPIEIDLCSAPLARPKREAVITETMPTTTAMVFTQLVLIEKSRLWFIIPDPQPVEPLPGVKPPRLSNVARLSYGYLH